MTEDVGDQESVAVKETEEQGDAVGVIPELGALPAGAILSEAGLAKILHRHPCSVRRAVARGELPPPVRLCGGPCWLAGKIVDHIGARLEAAAVEAEREARRLSAHRT